MKRHTVAVGDAKAIEITTQSKHHRRRPKDSRCGVDEETNEDLDQTTFLWFGCFDRSLASKLDAWSREEKEFSTIRP